MRISKLNKLLNLWQENNLITPEQNKNISGFMKERQKEQFFRIIKWFFIIGAFWVVFGLIASIVQLFDLSFMEKIKEFFVNFFVYVLAPFIFKYFINPVITYIISPVHDFLFNIFGENLHFFVSGIIYFILSSIILFLSNKFKANSIIDKFNLFQHQKYILKNTNLWLEIIGCILLSTGFIMFNKLLIPPGVNYYSYADKIFPLWHFLGAVTFLILAYRYLKVSYLLFGIYFVSLSVGMLSGYEYACYWIGTSRPVIQVLVGIILILTGYIHELKLKEDDWIKERFAQIYNSMGLLITFIALWIMSFWGFDLSYSHYQPPTAGELWVSNIFFIAASLGAMYYGAKFEHKVFFNYGLTFLIIESYTVFCSRIWDKMPISLASLCLGILLIITGKMLVKFYIKNNAAKLEKDKTTES